MKAIHTPPLQDRVEAVLQRAAKPGSVLRLALARAEARVGALEDALHVGVELLPGRPFHPGAEVVEEREDLARRRADDARAKRRRDAGRLTSS